MKVPIVVKIGALTVLSTAFYTYVGQLVPQKEVQPPAETKMSAEMTTADLVATGKTVMEGKGTCMTCHTIGKTSGPFRFPDLGGIGGRAGTQEPGLDALTYLAKSLYHPNDFIVPGFSPGMPEIHKPPIGLTDDEIRAVIAYLQSLGGTPNVTMQTTIPFAGGGGAPAAAPAGEATAVAASAPAASGGEGAGAAMGAAPAAVPAAAAAGPRDAQALVTQFQCATCHRLDQPGRLQAASLADVGARLGEPQIVGALASHPPMPGGFETASVAELRALARMLAAKKGGGA